MFACNRTGATVKISELEHYVFTNPELDEDLFLFETSPDVSQTAWDEARTLISAGLPENFSTDQQLEQFLRKSLEQGQYSLPEFKALDIHKTKEWEYDQAVLIAMFYYKFVAWS